MYSSSCSCSCSCSNAGPAAQQDLLMLVCGSNSSSNGVANSQVVKTLSNNITDGGDSQDVGAEDSDCHEMMSLTFTALTWVMGTVRTLQEV